MFAKAYTVIVKAVFINLFTIFNKNIAAKPSIRPDIRYPAFGLAGYLAGRISGKHSIRCIPIQNPCYLMKLGYS
jgi:hypothetical protein